MEYDIFKQCHLREKDIEDILRMDKEGMTQKEIGREKMVSQQTISSILNGHTHRFVTRITEKRDHRKGKLADDVVLEVRRMYDEGYRPSRIMEKFELSRQVVYNIVTRKSYKKVGLAIDK
jgi:DNA invertase Pin-like site-specific DNA recombinase